MTRRHAFAVVLVTSLLSVPSARGDDFTDFRIPAHKRFNWTGSFSANGGWFDGHQGGNPRGQGNLGSAFGTQAEWFSDSDPAQSYLSFGGLMTGSRSLGTNESHFADVLGNRRDSREEIRHRGLGESWIVSASHRRHPGSGPWGFSISTFSRARYNQSWFNDDVTVTQVDPGGTGTQISRRNDERWNYSYRVSASASIGYGRVRDATPVFEARTFEDRMVASGALTRSLSTEGSRKLAALFASNGDHGTTRDRPARRLWEEIERILREDGALGERGLDPYSVLRATEPFHGATLYPTRDGLPVSPVSRTVGSFIGPVAIVTHAHEIQRNDQDLYSETIFNGVSNVFTARNSGRDVFSADRVLAGLNGQWDRPVGMRWQLDASGIVLLPVRKEELTLDAGAGAAVSYIVSDRWLGNVTVQANWHDDHRSSGRTPLDRWAWVYGATVSRYIEDRTTLEIGIWERQDWTAGDPPIPGSSGGTRRYERSGNVSLGLTHRFAGMFDSNGLFPALAPGGLGRP